MMGRRGGLFATLAGALALAGLGIGCASDLVLENGRLAHRKYGFSFAEPSGDPPWQRTSLEDALAAWSRPGGARISVQAECGRNPPSPQVLARSLLIGVSRKQLLLSGPVAVGPWQGFAQVVDVGDAGRPLYLKTVTLVAAPCTVDFLLLAGEDFAALESGFDLWWQSFEAGAPARRAAS
jgi:hypothetical protein